MLERITCRAGFHEILHHIESFPLTPLFALSSNDVAKVYEERLGSLAEEYIPLFAYLVLDRIAELTGLWQLLSQALRKHGIKPDSIMSAVRIIAEEYFARDQKSSKAIASISDICDKIINMFRSTNILKASNALNKIRTRLEPFIFWEAALRWDKGGVSPTPRRVIKCIKEIVNDIDKENLQF